MCHESVIDFGKELIANHEKDFKNKTMLEIGSYNVNGTLQDDFRPIAKTYEGVDIEDGPGVDTVIKESAKLSDVLKTAQVVICTEMLEHAKDWREAVHAIKNLATEGIIVTTRSPGFPYHAYPEDYWRYTFEDFQHIFSDMDIVELQRDTYYAGVFLYARKPKNFNELDLTNIEVFAQPKETVN